MFELVVSYYQITFKRHRFKTVNVEDQDWAMMLSLNTFLILTHANLVFMYYQDQ